MRYLTLMLYVATAYSQTATQRPAGQPPDPVDTHNVLRVPGQENAKLHKDVVYTSSPNAPLKTDIYLPAGVKPSERLPVVIALSGAGNTKHWGFYKELGQLIAAHGMAGIIPDKRYERNQIPEGSEDILGLMKFLADNGAKYNLDASRVCLWAFSAGGSLLSVGMRGDTPQIKCLVNFYAVLDIGKFPGVPESFANGPHSPIARLREIDVDKLAPMLIVRAGRDREPLNAGIEDFIHLAFHRNAKIMAINYANGQHGFDLLDDNDFSRTVIKRALEFQQATLGIK